MFTADISFKDLPPEFRSRVVVEIGGRGCWVWGPRVGNRGYGMWSARPAVLAHRAVYEALVGPIAEGYDLHHRCEVRRCVRPSHLEPKLHDAHIRDHIRETGPMGAAAVNAARTACENGHPFTTTDNRGARICRLCANERTARWFAQSPDARERHNRLRRERRAAGHVRG